MGRKDRFTASWIRKLSGGLRGHGDLARAEFLNDWCLVGFGLELHSRAIVGSAKVSWVVDIHHDLYLWEGFLDTWLRCVNAIQTSLNDWLESGRPTLLYSFAQSIYTADLRWGPPEEPSEASVPSFAVVVSAVVLLALVYHYLTGNVDRGGSRAYSRSSLDFRDIYVAIVLFLGAYVWIKFREVAPKGWVCKTRVDKQGRTKVVYDARLRPTKWNNRNLRRLELGRFDTPQEAHNMFLIAAFYYNRKYSAGLLDGWFRVPPMSEEERSLTGLELREWVLGQAKKVYEDFKKGAEAEAALVQEILEACEGQATQVRVEVNVDPCGASLLNSAEPQQLVLVSQAEKSGMGMAMPDNHGLDCASDSFDGMHEGLALSDGHDLGFGEGSALPVSQLPPNTESGMNLNGSDQLDLLQSLMGTQPQQISLQLKQISDQQQQISLQQQQISDQQQISLQQIQVFGAQMLQFQIEQGIQQQQQLQESRIQNPQWSYQSYLQGQQLQDVNQGVPSFEMEMESYLRDQPLQDVNEGVPSFEMEMEQSMQEHNYSGLMAPPPDGGEF